MNKIVLIILLAAVNTFSQITITGDDINNIFAVGNSTTIKQDSLPSSVNIGMPGGNNVWDFTSLQYNIEGEYTSVDPASTAFIPYFPDATFCMHLEDFTQGFEADTWTYTSLNGFFNNYGGGLTSSNFPDDTLLTLNDPPRQTYIIPMTYNSQWSHTYTQSIYFNGMLLNSADATLSVIVDAYGTMTLPGGASYEALRIRETLTIAGITSVTYTFISTDGAQVTLFASSSNPPSSGVISVEETTYNSELQGGGGNTFVITQPEESEILIAGEVDTIAYENASGNVDLYYRADYNQDYILIDTSYSDPMGIYLWDVPDSLLTTRATVKIVESEDTNSVALSEEFKIKPWQLSRIDVNDDFELYEPDQDGWNFPNTRANQWPMTWWQQFDYSGTDPVTGNSYPNQSPFNNAASSRFPDWEMFVDMFTPPQCYTDFPPSTYRSAATTRWISGNGRWGGSCTGFTASSLQGFYHKGSLVQIIGSFDDLFNVGLNDTTRYIINLYQNHQSGKQTRDYRTQKFNNSARQLLSEVKEMLSMDNVDASGLAFWNNNGSGGHSVVPYKLERVGNTSTFNIKLYNCNAPGSLNNFIYVDSVANTWSDSTGLNWGTGTISCFLDPVNSDYISLPILERPNSMHLSNSDNPGSLRIEIYNTPDAEMIITSETGEQIGYQDSIAFNNMSDAVPIIPLTGGFHPPIGYDLPENNYSLELDNFTDSVSYAIFFTDSTIYNYRRANALNNETDHFEFSDNGIGITNPDQIVKYADFETIILQDTVAEKVFVATNVQISSSDSIHFREKYRNELLFQNYGDSMSYDLQIRYASVNGGENFLHMSVPMAQNSAHQIVPDWTDLNGEPTAIFIDLGNDGTIDDTIFVKNQATNIEDEGSLLSPDSYNLAQNYPNPFNPTTSIRYSIPKRSNVTLKVYDILGNEVVNLVNEEKDRGIYTVTFNAVDLASGIYFYTLHADGFVQTKKMLLIK